MDETPISDDHEKPKRRELPPRTKPGLPARGAALDLLRLTRRGRSLDEALTICRSFNDLEGADRAFARQLASTVLRRQGSLDEVVAAYLDRPLKANQHELRALLRLAAAQIVLLEVPPHAAASTAVDLARERQELRPFAKLVNALARRMAESGADTLEKLPPRVDTPGWLWRQLQRAYGPKKTADMALAHRQEPPLDMTVKELSSRDGLAVAIGASAVGPVSLRRTMGGRVEELAGYEDGSWWVQDVAATLPARLAGDIEDKMVYDLCAAPGGKTLQLAAAGAKVTAVDISPHRIERLHENLTRTGLSARVEEADILQWRPREKADVVLLDAPCTATGTIRRNPDLLWQKKEEEVDILSKLQDRMLGHALTLVKPGGLLIFATCSLLPEEGELRVEAALKRHDRLARVPVTPEEVGDLPVINKDGDIRCLPSFLKDQGGMDGFFVSRLRVD
ncbi:MAG: RsmB/NOP family class I SAM-dependent RNA methyltransferase [Pseudomonadota bacterium]